MGIWLSNPDSICWWGGWVGCSHSPERGLPRSKLAYARQGGLETRPYGQTCHLCEATWIPAFAGMTGGGARRRGRSETCPALVRHVSWGNRKSRRRNVVSRPCFGLHREGRVGNPPLRTIYGVTVAAHLPSLIQSETRSAIIMVVALVLARITSGMTEASTTRRPSSPRT